MMDIIGLILSIVLLFILLSLPFRFREEREYMEKRFNELEQKLNILQSTLEAQAMESVSQASEKVETSETRD